MERIEEGRAGKWAKGLRPGAGGGGVFGLQRIRLKSVTVVERTTGYAILKREK